MGLLSEEKIYYGVRTYHNEKSCEYHCTECTFCTNSKLQACDHVEETGHIMKGESTTSHELIRSDKDQQQWKGLYERH